MHKDQKRLLYVVLGPIIYLLCIFLIPHSLFTSVESRSSIGVVAWMAFWWVTAPIDYAVTAFIPIAVNAIVQMCDMSDVIANYASETTMLLLGASVLTVAWEKAGLDKRIAIRFLMLVGDNFRKQLVFWFLLSAVLSTVLPNAVVCAAITPIAVSMLKYIGEGDVANSRLSSKLLLYIAYGVGVGGLASPLGGGMNLVVVDYLQQVTGEEYMYTSWVIRFLPMMLILLVGNIVFMLRDVGKDVSLGGSKEYYESEYKKMVTMSMEEKWSLAMFVAATVLSFTRQFYQSILPGLKPAYVFIICAILAFFITKSDGNRLMLWKSVQGKIVWELIYMFAGGLAAGTLINQSGAAADIGNAMAYIGMTGGFAMVFVILAVTVLLSDITSNTATAAVSMPIVISITQGIGINPIPYIYVATIGINLSYMLPTSIRAIPVGYGLHPGYMLKEGWKLTLMAVVLMSVSAYWLMVYWPMFSTT